MRNGILTDEKWMRMRDYLIDDPNACVGNEADCRRFVEAVRLNTLLNTCWNAGSKPLFRLISATRSCANTMSGCIVNAS